jgi:ferredoxin-NADP reductase
MAMVRHRESTGNKTPVRLLYSSRAFEDIIYRGELDRLSAGDHDLKVAHTLTRSQPAGWNAYARRIDRDMVHDVAWPAAQNPCVFICGPTSFVETAAGLLVDAGYTPSSIKTERFGATGG